MEEYSRLANGIVIQAATDYRKALKTLHKGFNPHSKKALEAKRTKCDCEAFFQGDWIKMLTGVNGIQIMNKIREEINEN